MIRLKTFRMVNARWILQDIPAEFAREYWAMQKLWDEGLMWRLNLMGITKSLILEKLDHRLWDFVTINGRSVEEYLNEQ